MFGARLTLIVLTSQRLARIDLAGPRGHLRVERALSCPAITSSELAAAVAIAYRMGEPGGNSTTHRSTKSRSKRSVIVLSDDVWNDTLTLPLDITVLLQPEELRQALAIEAENFSGVSAFSSRIATRQLVDASTTLIDASSNLPTSNSWWMAQISDCDLASMTAATDACGVKFLGATHPDAYWRAHAIEGLSLENLDDQASLVALGQKWADALSQEGIDLLVRPLSNGSQRTNLGWLQSCAALLTALTCAGIYQLRSTQLQTAGSQLKQLQQTQSQYDRTTKELSKLRAADSQLQQARQKLSLSEKTTSLPLLITKPSRSPTPGHANWLAVFDALTTQTPDDCWIESWHSADATTTLVGRAVNAQLVHELASRVEHALSSTQWQVQPPIIRPDESQLLSFELPLSDNRNSRAAQSVKGGMQ